MTMATAESHWAIIESDTVTNVVVADTDFAAAQGWSTDHEPTGAVTTGAMRVTPDGVPALGYTTTDGGTTWTAPKPTPTAASRADALSALQAMLPTLGPGLEQAKADAEAYPTASPATQEAIVVRLIDRLAQVSEALGYLLAHQGYVPSTTP